MFSLYVEQRWADLVDQLIPEAPLPFKEECVRILAHELEPVKQGDPDVVHPVVRTHPETKRKGLYVNRSHVDQFEGMTVEESKPLLGFLYRHMERPEFTCRFRWENGSVAFWDNRAVHHMAVHDAGQFFRHVRRVQIAGDRPY